MKKTIGLFLAFLIFSSAVLTTFAQGTTYTVVKGDTMWKISVKYETGISELLKANPQIKTPSMILVGQKVNIPAADPLSAYENEVVRLINIQRTSRGIPALTVNWQLARVARYKSQDMVNKNYFSHTSPTYGSPFTMMQNFGLKFSAAGENIAYGQSSAQAVVTAWMNSPGHRANILSSAYTQTGVGAAKTADGTLYWTQDFMKPM